MLDSRSRHLDCMLSFRSKYCCPQEKCENPCRLCCIQQSLLLSGDIPPRTTFPSGNSPPWPMLSEDTIIRVVFFLNMVRKVSETASRHTASRALVGSSCSADVWNLLRISAMLPQLSILSKISWAALNLWQDNRRNGLTYEYIIHLFW